MIIIIRKKAALLLAAGGLLLAITALLLLRMPSLTTFATPDTEAVPLPIIMYHSILKSNSAQGTYVISPDVFEADIKYLQEHGYTTVFVSEVVAYVESGQPLPEKPVILSFDDGNLNNLTYIVPLLEKYGMKAVISVVGEFVEQAVAEDDHNPAYAYLTWEEICLALESGLVEIGNHTFALHSTGGRRGASPRQGETQEEFQQFLRQDLQKLQDNLKEYCNLTPIVFVYPYGLIHPDSLDVVKSLGFKASFSCNEEINYITRNANCLFCLGRYNRPAGISTAAFMKKIEARGGKLEAGGYPITNPITGSR